MLFKSCSGFFSSLGNWVQIKQFPYNHFEYFSPLAPFYPDCQLSHSNILILTLQMYAFDPNLDVRQKLTWELKLNILVYLCIAILLYVNENILHRTPCKNKQILCWELITCWRALSNISPIIFNCFNFLLNLSSHSNILQE